MTELEKLEDVQEDKIQEEISESEDSTPSAFTEEEIKKATEYLDSIKAEMENLVVPVWTIDSMLKVTVDKQSLSEYLKSWESKYLDTIIKATIVLPMAINTNQEVLKSMTEDLANCELWSEMYWAIRGNILATVTQIKSLNDDIESRIIVMKQYEEIITQLRALIG